MNFITKIFNNKKEIYLLSAINELKEDKKHLYDELTKKDALIESLINKLGLNTLNTKKVSENGLGNLTPLENKIYTAIIDNPNIKRNELAILLSLKLNSLRVYLSKLRSKGYTITI